MKPIIFVLGLSGAGKDYVSKMLEERCSLLRKNMDRKGGRGFELASFPAEWDKDISLVDFANLSESIRGDVTEVYQGVVLSFPTTYRFGREQLEIASTHGVGVVMLWGALERCWDVRRERQEKNKGTTPDHADYLRKNRPTFEMYEGAEYDKFKVEAFQPGGSRPPREILLALVLARLASQGIELTASSSLGGR